MRLGAHVYHQGLRFTSMKAYFAVTLKVARNILKDSPADVEYKVVAIGDKSRAVLARQYSQNILFSGNEIGRTPPTFEDASIAANAILNSDYEFDSGAIIYNRFKTVVSYDTKQLPIMPIETIRQNEKSSVVRLGR